MSENEYDGYREEDAIDLMKYWNKIKSNWKTILYWAAGAFVLGCAVALATPRKYTVTTKLAPELSANVTTRMSSLASLVGISSATLGTTDAVYPMVYPDILKSAHFMVELFDVPVTFTEKGEQMETSFYEYMTEHKKFSLKALPFMAVGAVVGLFSKEDEEEASDSLVVDPFHLTKKQGKLVAALKKQIISVTDKKTMAMTITVTMEDPVVAATIAQAVSEKLREHVTQYRTKKAIKDCEYYEGLHDKAQQEYYDALMAYSNYADSHQKTLLLSNQIEGQRLKNESDLKYQLYNSTSQQLQMARAKVQQETPVFAELIPPTVPIIPSNSKKKTALVFAFLGLLAGAVWVCWKK